MGWIIEGSKLSPSKDKNILFCMLFRLALGPTQTLIQWVLGVKWPGNEADHSPPPGAKIKKTWFYVFTPLYILMA
jgi:hypothetical protein